MKRILIHSNAPTKRTGYSEQTKLFAHALMKVGYEVFISSFAGLEGSPQMLDGIYTLPRGVDGYGNDVIAANMQYVQADLVWSLIDLFALDTKTWVKLPWCAWAVIDSSPIRAQETEQFQACRWVMAMSRFGEKELRDFGRDPLYVPHAVDTDVFHPVDRDEAREKMIMLAELGDRSHRYRTAVLPKIEEKITKDTFVIATVAANGTGWPSRKNFDGMLTAFAIFNERHPNSVFYIHSEPLGIWKGEPLIEMAAQYSLEDKVYFPSSYAMLMGLVDDATLNCVYNAADVFLLLSRGGSFEIPLAESQSAGTPVITTNASAMRENCLTGWTVNGLYHAFSPMTRQMVVDPLQAVQWMEQAYGIWERGEMPALRQRTRDAAVDRYDIRTVMQQYALPAFLQIAHDLEKEPHSEWLRRRQKAARNQPKKKAGMRP